MKTFLEQILKNCIDKQKNNQPIDSILEYANRHLRGYGVENIYNEEAWINSYYGGIVALYVNMGDTYDTTILYDTDDNTFYLTTMGDFIEDRGY